MNKTCIYCGIREATEQDHVPPKCFFPIPRPSNLITVPCCGQCNDNFSKDDERVRNLITSLETTEQNKAIKSQLASKRNRSMFRERGITNLNHLIKSIIMKERYSQGVLYLGKAPAFNLDQPLMDRFFNRMTRAILYHENSIGYVNCKIEWEMASNLSDYDRMPDEIKESLGYRKFRSIGNDIFAYAGWCLPEIASSLWLLHFYGAVKFMTLLSENKSKEK